MRDGENELDSERHGKKETKSLKCAYWQRQSDSFCMSELNGNYTFS